MTLWLTINSVGLVILAALLVLLVRQVGFILNRVGSAGGRPMQQGPRQGENIAYRLSDLSASGLGRLDRPTLYIFASSGCSLCGVVRSAAEELARNTRIEAQLVMVYDKLVEDNPTVTPGEGRLGVLEGGDLYQRLDIHAFPYAVMADADQTVLGHGLVNSAADIEKLLSPAGDDARQDPSSQETSSSPPTALVQGGS